MLIKEEKEKFQIFSIRLRIRILLASMLILEEKEQFKNVQVSIQIAASRRGRDWKYGDRLRVRVSTSATLKVRVTARKPKKLKMISKLRRNSFQWKQQYYFTDGVSPPHAQTCFTLCNARKSVATRENYKVLLLAQINMGDGKNRIRIFEF